jgi:hypothetical protein
MNSIHAMRRANGDWFALKKLDGLRVPVFYDEAEAIRARTFNVEMLVFKPTLLDEGALDDLVADSEKPSHFWLVEFGCPTLRRGQVLTRSELMNMCQRELRSSAKASNLSESIAISK